MRTDERRAGTRPGPSLGLFIGVGLAVAVALAFLVAPRASSSPDGLEKVAADEGFIDGARDHSLADAPTADYGVAGLDHEALGTGLAGLAGILITFGVVWGALTLIRRSSRRHSASPPAAPGRPAAGTSV